MCWRLIDLSCHGITDADDPGNDAGFLINRGTSENVGLIWDETNDKFKLIARTRRFKWYNYKY